MSSRSQNKVRSSRADVEAIRSNREPYAILWLDGREVCLYEEDGAAASSERQLN